MGRLDFERLGDPSELIECEAALAFEAAAERRVCDACFFGEAVNADPLYDECICDLVGDFGVWCGVETRGCFVHAANVIDRLDNCNSRNYKRVVRPVDQENYRYSLCIARLALNVARMDTYGDRLEAAIRTQLRVELAARDMSQQEFAAALDMPSATLSRYMKGHRSIPMPVFFKMAEVLGVTAKVLMEQAEDRL